MSLMTLVRLFAALFLGWTVVALGIGAMGVGSPAHPSPGPPTVEPARQGVMTEIAFGTERSELFDLATGRILPLRLPEDDRWTMVDVAPWRDSRDDVEVIGRWVSHGEGEFCGMGSFRLSDGAVISRIPMEVLPTGRACCVPGQQRTILFPVGDGQLYRCLLPAREVVDGIPIADQDGASRSSPVPVTWKVPVPGSGCVMLADPVWPSESALRRWLIVSLTRQGQRGTRRFFLPSELWWLELDEQAASIVAAGRLTAPEGGDADESHALEQYPNVAIGPEGTIQMVYLSSRKGEKTGRLCSADLHFDARTGRPCLASGPLQTRTLGEGLGLAPLLITADGKTVIGMDDSGRVSRFSLTRKTD
jgi:hypothetical protein